MNGDQPKKNGKLSMPGWAINLLCSLVGGLLVAATLYGQARADVEHLKNQYAGLRQLPSAVASNSAMIGEVRGRVDSIHKDFRQYRSEQNVFQSDIQRDIKTLLGRQ